MTGFAKILIANRGEIAVRIHRTAREMGYRTVAVYSDADKAALHVATCDEAVRIGPAPVGESYLSIDRILEAAHTSGADAVHPGYGFLSENAEFATACEKAGLVFIGPPPAAIAAMGNKAAAKRRMIDTGVPCVPGYQGADQSDANLETEAHKIGLPVMVKAAAGGGGRGMRLVERDGDLLEAIRTARAEAESAFGSGELILEKAVVDARHVEIQVFADAHGNVIHLGERDCSVQRRHQKVIEEAPSPAVDPGLRDRMGAAAVAAAKAIGYRGAGTVEFLLAGDGAFYFLEMNTRLQVEHPVTEEITGLDLVEWQLRVSRGERLPLTQEQVKFKGHAIEVRLYAEDAYNGFLPQAGRVDVWRPAFGAGVRLDYGVTNGSTISPFYDPMIAKVIAHGATREEARIRLVRALRETVILGPTTNRHFLIRLLEHPDFAAGKATTAFLVKHDFPAPAIGDAHWDTAARLLWRASAARYPAPLRGWRNSNPEPTPIRLAAGGAERLLQVTGGDGIDAPFHIDGEDIVVDLDALTVRFTDRTYAPPATAAAGSDGKLRAPMDGRIVAIKVAAGDKVARGQTLVVLEAMKIQHQLKAALDAKVESISVQEGQQVANRAVLITMASEGAGGASRPAMALRPQDG
jgi:geranyl-CoA carboxylase alpha subunit